VGILGL